MIGSSLVLLVICVGVTHANISWGSYSYKYLSAVIQVSDEYPFPDTADPNNVLPSEGAYGYSSSYNAVSGKLIQPTPLDGCPASPGLGVLQDASQDAIYDLLYLEPGTPWIALIERGECLFTEKINLAFNQSAVGAIIFNEAQATSVVPMEYISPSDEFVAIMIDRTAYDELNEFFGQGTLGYVNISPGSPQVSNSFERIVIATISVSFLILLALSVGWVIIYYVQRFRIIHRRYREAKRRQDLAERAIKLLKNRKLKRNDKLVQDEESCAICIDEFEQAAVCLELPCKHVFHKKCIEPWVLDKGTCPMCKLNVFVALGLEQRGNSSSDAENGNTDTSPNPVWTTIENQTTSLNNDDVINNDIAFQEESLHSDDNSSTSSNHQAPQMPPSHPFDRSHSETLHQQTNEEEVSPSHVPLTLTRVDTSSSSPRTDTSSRNTTPLPGIEEVLPSGNVNQVFQDDDGRIT